MSQRLAAPVSGALSVEDSQRLRWLRGIEIALVLTCAVVCLKIRSIRVGFFYQLFVGTTLLALRHVRSKSFIGLFKTIDERYRDFGDKVQYEGPYDFHSEVEMSKLLSKLKHIRAKGGTRQE